MLFLTAHTHKTPTFSIRLSASAYCVIAPASDFFLSKLINKREVADSHVAAEPGGKERKGGFYFPESA